MKYIIPSLLVLALNYFPPYAGYTSSQARLLMAQVQLMQGNYKQAQQSLEVGISFNFEVSRSWFVHQNGIGFIRGTQNVAKLLQQCNWWIISFVLPCRLQIQYSFLYYLSTAEVTPQKKSIDLLRAVDYSNFAYDFSLYVI